MLKGFVSLAVVFERTLVRGLTASAGFIDAIVAMLYSNNIVPHPVLTRKLICMSN